MRSKIYRADDGSTIHVNVQDDVLHVGFAWEGPIISVVRTRGAESNTVIARLKREAEAAAAAAELAARDVS